MLEAGSIWRRWDLHIHTPETILNDQFGTWDEFLSEIEGQDAVRVVGVTDYFSIANYSKLKKYKANGRIPGIDLLIPNIEFPYRPAERQRSGRQHTSSRQPRRSRPRDGDTEGARSAELGIRRQEVFVPTRSAYRSWARLRAFGRRRPGGPRRRRQTVQGRLHVPQKLASVRTLVACELFGCRSGRG